jgi:Ca2+-binding EF-hand superfamily protein
MAVDTLQQLPFAFPPIDDSMEDSFVRHFRAIDADGNGVLDKKEFQAFLRAAGSPDSARYLFNIIDADGNGTISLQEFLEFCHAVTDITAIGDLRPYLGMVFTACDKRKKGGLDPQEFYRFMKYIGQPVKRGDKQALFKKVDVDGSGTVELAEIFSRVRFTLAPI